MVEYTLRLGLLIVGIIAILLGNDEYRNLVWDVLIYHLDAVGWILIIIVIFCWNKIRDFLKRWMDLM